MQSCARKSIIGCRIFASLSIIFPSLTYPSIYILQGIVQLFRSPLFLPPSPIQKSSKSNGILLPYHLPIFEQQRRHADEGNSDEPQHTVSPPQSQRLIHTWGSKWQQGAEKTTQTRHACDCARGVLRKAVDHVCLQGREDAH